MSTFRNAVSLSIPGLLLAAAAAFGVAGPASAQQPIVLKFGNQTQNDVQHEYMKVYKAKLEEATKGKIRVDLFPASQLGPFPRQIEGLRLGNIQALTGPFEFFVGVDPAFQVTSMAGLFRDVEHIRKVADNPKFREIMNNIGEKKGVVSGSFIVYDMQHFTFKTPVKTLADFKGKRMRVLASEAEQSAVSALGASPIPMPLPEVLPALQQGTIDSVSSGLSIFTSLRYYDAAPHVIEGKLWGIMTAVMFSKTWLSELPPDLQKTVLDTAKSIEAENHKWLVAFLVQARETWSKNGGTFAKFSPEEQIEAQKRVSEATAKVLAKYPAVKTVYDQVKAIADATK